MRELRIDHFDRDWFEHGSKERLVFRRGSGPAVIVMAEMPGITPNVLRFAGSVADIGCTAVLPHLFGVPGRGIGKNAFVAGLHVNQAFFPACVSKEFTVWATGRTSPVVEWLRALASHEHERCGGPGVGAVGMCFTGGYALAMATHPAVVAPVLSQPSMPLNLTKRQGRSIDCSSEDLAVVKQRPKTSKSWACASRGTATFRRAVSRSFAITWATRSSQSSWTTTLRTPTQ